MAMEGATKRTERMERMERARENKSRLDGSSEDHSNYQIINFKGHRTYLYHVVSDLPIRRLPDWREPIAHILLIGNWRRKGRLRVRTL